MAWAQSNGRRKVSRRRTGDEEYEWPDSFHDDGMNIFHQFFAAIERRSDGPRQPEMPPMPPGTRPKRLGPEQQMSPRPPRYSSHGWEEDGPRRPDTPRPSRTEARRLEPEQQMSPRPPARPRRPDMPPTLSEMRAMTKHQLRAMSERQLRAISERQLSSRPPAHHSSLGWEEERPLPPHRESSSRWQEAKPLTGLGILPSRSQPCQPAHREAWDALHGQRHGAKVGLQTPFTRRQRSPEEDDEDESGSSRSSSLSGSTLIAESDDRSSQGSDRFEVIEHDVFERTSGSADEDGYVHLPGSDRRSYGRSFRTAHR